MKHLIPFFLILGIFPLGLISCSDDDDETTEPQPPASPTVSFNLSPSPINLQGITADYAEDVPYDSKTRTLFDIWMPASSTPTGLVVYIHGGGFQGGDKGDVKIDSPGRGWIFSDDILQFLGDSIAFATINYSLLDPFGQENEGVIKSMNDCKRFLQYIRYYASSFNIDKNKIMLAGNSAGGGTSLWIAFNDDFADATNSDPILRESTRVMGVAVREIQASYDIEGRWFNQVFEDYPTITFNAYRQANGNNFLQFYGLQSDAQYDQGDATAYRAEVDMLALMSVDDPAIWASNVLRDVALPNDGDLILHHAYHAREVKEKADSLGLENVISYGKGADFVPDPNRPNESWVDFCVRIIQGS